MASSGEVESFLGSMQSKLGGVPCDFSRFRARPVFVGDDVTADVSMFGNKIKTGDGLFAERGKVIATQAGILQFQQPNVYWVEHYDHRYRPHEQDNVIGVVRDSFADAYKVDIRSGSDAQLPTLAFDGASKRNRPSYEVGTLVYARVAKVHRDMDPELSCMVANGPKKDWMSGESIYGELKGGYVFKCSLGLANKLLDPTSPVLAALAKALAFEIAIGVNGFIWVNAQKSQEIALLANAITKSEELPDDQIPGMVATLLETILRRKT